MSTACTKSPNDAAAIEAIEWPLLLEAVWRRHGYDFRDYAPASLKRRVRRAMELQGLPTLSALQDAVLHDERAMAAFLDNLTVEVTAMFRDLSFYRTFRAKVVPLLRPLPLIRVWHAACSSGEEVYSMAILLHEAARGLAAIARAGGLCLVQTPESAEATAMPAAALPLERIAPRLVELLGSDSP